MADQNSFGTQLPITEIYDVSDELSANNYNNASLAELLVRLYQNSNNIVEALNAKDAGFYDTQQVVCGQQFFPNPNPANPQDMNWNYRPVIRKLVFYNSGLPNAGTVAIPHGIDFTNAANATFTRIYGVANNPTTNSSLPLPYAHPTAANMISVDANFTNINVTTGNNRLAWTINYFVLEFLMY